jgi:hypothetical protein
MGQPYWKKSRSAKVKDGIINLFLRNNLIGRYTHRERANMHCYLIACTRLFDMGLG